MITIVEIFSLLGMQTADRYHQLSEMPWSFGVNIFTCHETLGLSCWPSFQKIFAKLNICEKISDVLSLLAFGTLNSICLGIWELTRKLIEIVRKSVFIRNIKEMSRFTYKPGLTGSIALYSSDDLKQLFLSLPTVTAGIMYLETWTQGLFLKNTLYKSWVYRY